MQIIYHGGININIPVGVFSDLGIWDIQPVLLHIASPRLCMSPHPAEKENTRNMDLLSEASVDDGLFLSPMACINGLIKT